ncbi:MAG: rod shape-determining protein MreD [Gemmatimonadetes bacterium]|nr:rod shape-determining protein MreD [Gemmatimonadota bacterium]MDE2677408.1 rod shape-determining protein MreD [Gemmatimonadota bacterium]MXX36222.1 rod shape-determining protein MreD [Gemmatimonadota bacterium]MYA10917.1 rod shape-determining protein MreD [Gemmatimonadota bacterium]MYD12762.1 rod shape-determining protein MreD [Gemmatimonadota bacterium]
MNVREATVVAGLIVAHLLLRIGFGLQNAAPDLMLLALLLASRSLSLGGGALVGFCLGLLEDAFSMLSFGASVFALTLVGTMGAQVRHMFVGRSIFFQSTYFFLAKWVRDLLAWLVSNPDSRDVFVDHVLIESPVAALYVAAAGLSVRYLFLKDSARE